MAGLGFQQRQQQQLQIVGTELAATGQAVLAKPAEATGKTGAGTVAMTAAAPLAAADGLPEGVAGNVFGEGEITTAILVAAVVSGVVTAHRTLQVCHKMGRKIYIVRVFVKRHPLPGKRARRG